MLQLCFSSRGALNSFLAFHASVSQSLVGAVSWLYLAHEGKGVVYGLGRDVLAGTSDVDKAMPDSGIDELSGYLLLIAVPRNVDDWDSSILDGLA